MASTHVRIAIVGSIVLSARVANAEQPPLSDFFGFEPLEVIRIDRSAGPICTADINGDGYNDIIIANNLKSRIELHVQKPGSSPDDVLDSPAGVNDLPEHWRFERIPITVSHHVRGLVIHDFDKDGRQDIIYGGDPSEIVFLRQIDPSTFEVARKHRVPRLAVGQDGLAISDLLGSSDPELIGLADGNVVIWSLSGDDIVEQQTLAAGGEAGIVAFHVEDYDGNGQSDLLAVIPENPSPVRIWFGRPSKGGKTLGPQRLFQMPPIIESKPVRLPKQKAALIAVIERQSKRIALYNVDEEKIRNVGKREAATSIYSFSNPKTRSRRVLVADADADGLSDVIATDTDANAVVLFRQKEDGSFAPPQPYPSLADLADIAAGNVDSDKELELFVLSEKEAVVGRSDMTNAGVTYPRPLPVSDGHTPLAMSLIELQGEQHIAVIVKESRNHAVDLIDMRGQRRTFALSEERRSPDDIIALDADQDGMTDLLVFTPERPMQMLRANESDEGFELIQSDAMGQFGLVKSATASNTAIFDIDGDGHDELLVADRNFVRAVRYDTNPAEGFNPGWQVVAQVNADDSTSKLVSLTRQGNHIIAADQANNQLIIIARTGDHNDATLGWHPSKTIYISGFKFDAVYAAHFGSDAGDRIVVVGDEGFAIAQFAGERMTLDEFASWRTDAENRVQHELRAGDVNGDGFTDLVSVDAGEQLCEIFTFSEAGRFLYAASFPVFESKLFTSGDRREYEPREIMIDDLTGDGEDDLLFIAHDRLLLYPQTTLKH